MDMKLHRGLTDDQQFSDLAVPEATAEKLVDLEFPRRQAGYWVISAFHGMPERLRQVLVRYTLHQFSGSGWRTRRAKEDRQEFWNRPVGNHQEIHRARRKGSFLEIPNSFDCRGGAGLQGDDRCRGSREHGLLN
jgi:hypothetical protein